MTQPQVTALSNPAAPAANAQFVSATMAPPTFVFRPGATLPSNLGVQQNVFTSPNSSGTDGLTLLQGVLNGLGLFPNIPLPSSVVECDFSNISQQLTLAASLNLGQFCRLKGLPVGTAATSAIPEILTNGFSISGLHILDNMKVFSPRSSAVGGIVTAMGNLIMCGNAQIEVTGLTGSGFFYDTVHGGATIYAYDNSIIGSNAIIVRSGTTVTINLFDNAQITGNITVISGGTLVINVYSPSARAIQQSNGSGTTVIYSYNTSNQIIYCPSSPLGGPGRFTDFGELCSHISAYQETFEPWVIIIDGTGDPSGNVTIPANLFYVLPVTVEFLGVTDQSNTGTFEYPTLIFAPDVTFQPPNVPFELTFTNLTVENQNVSVPVFTAIGSNFVLNSNNSSFSNTGGMPLIDLPVAAPTVLNGTISGESFIGTNTLEVETGSDAFLFFEQSTLSGGGITVSGGTIELTADSMSTIDNSYFPDTTFSSTVSYTNPNALNANTSPVGVSPPDTTFRLDTTGGPITLDLPPVVKVPFDGWKFYVWIALSSGANAVSFVPDGTAGETIMSPVTGLYGANFTSTGLYSGQGTLYTVEWNLGGNAWLVSVKVPG